MRIHQLLKKKKKSQKSNERISGKKKKLKILGANLVNVAPILGKQFSTKSNISYKEYHGILFSHKKS